MTTNRPWPDPTPPARSLPPDAVLLAPAPPDTVPMRPPAGAWGLVVVAVRTTDTAGSPVRLVTDPPAPDTAHLCAGVWLTAPPPADLHTGDVVVRLHPPAAADTVDTAAEPVSVDVEVLAAMDGQWRTIRTWPAVGARWPHEVAPIVLPYMRYLADAAFTAAQWATLTGPVAAALPAGLLPSGLAGKAADSDRRARSDALAALIDAGLIEVGEQVVFDGHTATVRESGVLHDGGPHPFDVSTVTALASSLAGYTTNGWHLWRRARDHRALAELRTELATR